MQKTRVARVGPVNPEGRGSITPVDLLHSTHQHGTSGLKIHVEDGEERSLLSMNKSERRQFRGSAAQLGLRVHVETSSTARHDLEAAVAIARDIKAESVRCYSRYEGRVSEIIRKTIDDLRALRDSVGATASALCDGGFRPEAASNGGPGRDGVRGASEANRAATW